MRSLNWRHLKRFFAAALVPSLMGGASAGPAAGNVFANITAMLFGIMGFNVNPLPFFVTMLVGHIFVAGYAARDPHVSGLISAWMMSRRKTTNLIKVRGNKYVP